MLDVSCPGVTWKSGVLSLSMARWTKTWALASSSMENNPTSGASSTPGPLIKYFSEVLYDLLLNSFGREKSRTVQREQGRWKRNKNNRDQFFFCLFSPLQRGLSQSQPTLQPIPGCSTTVFLPLPLHHLLSSECPCSFSEGGPVNASHLTVLPTSVEIRQVWMSKFFKSWFLMHTFCPLLPVVFYCTA